MATPKFITIDEFKGLIKSDMSIMIGGFGYCGYPLALTTTMCDMDLHGLTLIGHGPNAENTGHGPLLFSGRAKKYITSIMSAEFAASETYKSGKVEVEHCPMGTMVERMRAGGYGLGGVLTPAGVGTDIEAKEEVIEVDGKRYILAKALRADVALLHANTADKLGNLHFEGTTANFNTQMAMAADTVIVQVDKVVEIGEIDPDDVTIPGCVVDYIVEVTPVHRKRKEHIIDTSKKDIAARAGKLFKNGDVVNLGIGIPTLIPDYLPEGVKIFVHGEDGVIGIEGADTDEYASGNYVDAGAWPVTLIPGASTFDCGMSFGIMRGGHLDVTCLGCYEVDASGSFANWTIPGVRETGMGGAMDLVAGTKCVVVTMTHTDKKGNPKILNKCTLPLTGKNCVDYIVTELCILHVTDEGLVLEDLADGVTVEELQAKTEPTIIVPEKFRK